MEQLEAADSMEAVLFALAAGASCGSIWLHLLVADRCNHTCLHCYQVQGIKGELTREQIENLLREFRARGGFVVSFSGGEATLRDDLIPLLAYAHELGLATVLYTNGFSMTPAVASAIAACHVWRVDISVYSHLAEEHDAVTRVPGSWAKTTQGIRWLRENRVNVSLKFTPTALSTASAQQLSDLARELDSHLLVGELVTAGEGGRPEPTKVRRQPGDAVADFEAPTLQLNTTLKAKPCGAGSLLSVRSDGQVQPCAQLSTPMGRIGNDATGLAQAAQSDVAQFFREVTWADFPGCRECDLRVHCRRCFASAAAEVGDMLAPYRGACELAVARYQKFSGKSGFVAAGEVSASDQDLTVGPYRLDASGNLQPANERYTAYDRALADRYPWLRPTREALQSAACSADPAHQEHGLVQLRRTKRSDYEGTANDDTR
jgi:radical SAM protein with 4Fe4S-binding SPASM domain